MLTRRELRAFSISASTRSLYTERFSLPLIEDHVPEHLLGTSSPHLDPQDDGAVDDCGVKAARHHSLSQKTGKSVSNIRSKIICSFRATVGVQLESSQTKAPRFVVLFYRCFKGCLSPNFKLQIVSDDSPGSRLHGGRVSAKKLKSQRWYNVFGEIASRVIFTTTFGEQRSFVFGREQMTLLADPETTNIHDKANIRTPVRKKLNSRSKTLSMHL
jgi:hypothetical protein